MNRTTIADCTLLEFPKIADRRGNLTFLEGETHLPFAIKRVFYLYDVPGGATRAGHALKSCGQVLIAISGSFDVVVKDGKSAGRVHLNRSFVGLYIPPRIWREIENFSTGSICLVLASERYSEKGYYRKFNSFLKAVAGARR